MNKTIEESKAYKDFIKNSGGVDEFAKDLFTEYDNLLDDIEKHNEELIKLLTESNTTYDVQMTVFKNHPVLNMIKGSWYGTSFKIKLLLKEKGKKAG